MLCVAVFFGYKLIKINREQEERGFFENKEEIKEEETE